MSETNRTGGVVLFASVGPTLTRYTVDVESATLTRQDSLAMPENVHYAWPHVSGRFLYVVTSDSAPGKGPTGDGHHAVALSIDPGSGALAPHGSPIALPSRPIHAATDIRSTHLLVAFSRPGQACVYRIGADGALGGEVKQTSLIEPGIYPHQIRASLDNKHVILVARGHDATAEKAEEPGALKVFDYADGQLGNEVSIAPNGGYGFGPRHLDFHPTQPWIYVSLERQNALALFTWEGNQVSAEPRFVKQTLAGPFTTGHHQMVGTVRVHPNGRVAYVANRASSTRTVGDKKVFAGGENNLAVFSIDQASGEPTLIQNVDTRGIHCRNFHIDPSGRLLVASHIMSLPVEDGATLRTIPARLSVFRIAPDGRLDFVRSYDVDVGDATMFWMGMVAL